MLDAEPKPWDWKTSSTKSRSCGLKNVHLDAFFYLEAQETHDAYDIPSTAGKHVLAKME